MTTNATTNAIVINYHSGKTEVYPTDTKLQLQLALMNIVDSFDYIDSIWDSNIVSTTDTVFPQNSPTNLKPMDPILTFQDSLEKIKHLHFDQRLKYSEIARHLTKHDYPTAKGGLWHSSTIRYLVIRIEEGKYNVS